MTSRTTVGMVAAAAVAAAGLVVALLAVGVTGDAAAPPAGPPPRTASPSPATSPAPTPVEETLVMWARGGLAPDVAERVAELPPVTAVAFVRSATLGLVASRDADGATVEELRDGYRVPVAVSAVSPADLAATLPVEVRDAVSALRPGEVLLSETSASLRRLGPGGEIDLASRPGLVVAGVVPDGTVRRAEIVLHVADAADAGVDEDGSLVVRYRAGDTGGPTAAAIEAAIRDVVPQEPPVRIVGGGETFGAPLVLPLVEVKARFGELAYRPRPGVREIDADPAFVAEHIVGAEVPLLGTVRCHRDIVEDLRGALSEVAGAGLADTIDPARYGGCFYPRLIAADRDGLSRHSWGIAIDINVDLSVPGLGEPPPRAVIAAFERHGFRWGGDFLQPDNHHFEWVGRGVGQ